MGIRYHIDVGKQRTTVSLNSMLSEYLSLKLGHTPHTPEAHKAVHLLLQGWVDDLRDPGLVRFSQWLSYKAIDYIVDKDLYEKC